MNYKFLAQYMCSKHVGITNYWLLVKQVLQEVSVEEQRIVSDLMYEYYQELKNNDKLVFNIDKIDSMNDETFKTWFFYDKKTFQQICCFKTCEPKYCRAHDAFSLTSTFTLTARTHNPDDCTRNQWEHSLLEQ